MAACLMLAYRSAFRYLTYFLTVILLTRVTPSISVSVTSIGDNFDNVYNLHDLELASGSFGAVPGVFTGVIGAFIVDDDFKRAGAHGDATHIANLTTATNKERLEPGLITTTKHVNQFLLWGCLLAILIIGGISVMYLYAHLGSSSVRAGHRADVLVQKSRALSAEQRCIRTSARSSPVPSNHTLRSLGGASGDLSSASDTRSGRGSELPGLPLCHLLVVPEGTRLACVVQNDVRRRRQELSFDISAIPTRGGAPLFRMRVSELGKEERGSVAPSGIFVETLNGREQLASLSTEEIWSGSVRPSLAISRPWGLPYGMLQKDANGAYLVLRGSTTLLAFSGDFVHHSIEVKNSSGHVIATTSQHSSEEYQVQMQARTDAGLVILSLLAIDKCEMPVDSPDC